MSTTQERSQRMIPRGVLAGAISIGVGIVGIVVLIAFWFPLDMDEILPYHQIACDAAAQRASVYTAACNGYPTQFGPFEFQRPFNYVGASMGWLMFPVFAVTKALWLHTAFGVVVLVLAAWGVVKSVRLNVWFLPAAIVYFPIAFATIHDTGPIRISLVVLAWTPVALRSYLRSTGRWKRLLLAAILLIGWLAATESKPYFMFLIPGVVAWCGAALVITDGAGWVHQQWRRGAVLLSGLALACLALLVILRTDGVPYLVYLTRYPSPNDLLVNFGTGATFIADWPFTAHRMMNLYPNVDLLFFKPLQSPMNALPVTADRGGLLALALTVAASASAIVLYVWAGRRLWKTNQRTAVIAMISAAAMLFLGALISGGGSNHHFVYAHLPLLALVLLAFNTLASGPLKAGITLVVVSALALAAAVSVPLKPPVSRDIDTIMQAAIGSADATTVINCQSWGCYYQYSFMNIDNVPIAWAETPEEQARLLSDAQSQGRSILHVCLSCTQLQVEAGYPGTRVTEAMTTPSGWRLFEVEY
jgi:hypothetical protein